MRKKGGFFSQKISSSQSYQDELPKTVIKGTRQTAATSTKLTDHDIGDVTSPLKMKLNKNVSSNNNKTGTFQVAAISKAQIKSKGGPFGDKKNRENVAQYQKKTKGWTLYTHPVL